MQDVFGPAGWTAAFLGLLGLYPRLAKGTRQMARSGAICVGIGMIGAVVIVAANLTELVGLVDDSPIWIRPLNLLIFVGIIPGFLAFSVAVLGTAMYSRSIGLLLIVPALIFIVNFLRVLMLGSTTPIWAPFVLGSSQAAALLAIGYLLRREGSDYPMAASAQQSSTRNIGQPKK